MEAIKTSLGNAELVQRNGSFQNIFCQFSQIIVNRFHGFFFRFLAQNFADHNAEKKFLK